MSFFPGKDPQAGDTYACEAIAHVVVPRTVDLGDGFSVRRALPSARSRMVGPFIFFDHFGPAEFRAGNGLDVRPHPHIGLATVTYLFDGEIMHRDSLGTAAPIKPGEINLMTAGRGIVHSERTGTELRATGSPIHGLQMWVALPAAKEEMAPAFAHHEVGEFPLIMDDGKVVRVVIGSLYGERSPVPTVHETMFANIALRAGATLPLDADHEERALYVIDGSDRHLGRQIRARASAGVQAGRPGDDQSADRRASGDLRRRADGRAAPHLVELRVVAQGAHRAGQGGMGGRPFRQGAGRRDRVHSAAGEISRPRRRSTRRRCPTSTPAVRRRAATPQRWCRSGSTRPRSGTGRGRRPTDCRSRASARSCRKPSRPRLCP